MGEGETLGSIEVREKVPLYNSSKSNISEHIKHILEEGELTLEATVRKFRTVQKEGEREVGRNIAYYNLDMILAIDYRVRSNVGTNFRKWATSTLKEYVTKGFALNDEMLKEAGGDRFGIEHQTGWRYCFSECLRAYYRWPGANCKKPLGLPKRRQIRRHFLFYEDEKGRSAHGHRPEFADDRDP